MNYVAQALRGRGHQVREGVHSVQFCDIGKAPRKVYEAMPDGMRPQHAFTNMESRLPADVVATLNVLQPDLKELEERTHHQEYQNIIARRAVCYREMTKFLLERVKQGKLSPKAASCFEHDNQNCNSL